MVCPQCGATSEAGQRFCYNCGARLDVPQATQPSPPPQQPTMVSPQPQAQNLPPQPAPIQEIGYPQGAYAPPAVPNSNMAIVSLVAGIVAWVLLPGIAAIVAVITGHMARNEINRSGGSLAGGGLATIGLILGYANLAIILLAFCGILLFVLGIGALA